MSDFHRESWSPEWTGEKILLGLLSFMIDPEEPPTLGAVICSAAAKKTLALKGFAANQENTVFRSLFPEFLVKSKWSPQRGFRSVATERGRAPLTMQDTGVFRANSSTERWEPAGEGQLLHGALSQLALSSPSVILLSRPQLQEPMQKVKKADLKKKVLDALKFPPEEKKDMQGFSESDGTEGETGKKFDPFGNPPKKRSPFTI
uniref:UBC core domain-containing protein n=1 Tax=Chromera velia CCMP2878 TaxID=1169474 RepID=A0A0G4GYR6_9ALVE|eukprot:Cvel_23959.t1-p1 / transcript=Cvel_23959.t1 / gene=Cvel_23959 / organism=Chromera_velia_CCMP2878 / gene_product=Probable ubiquitin-conjugating enzyme E2 33, putative / transcript_product=Probable ubiquitin-conjugating enzyme E2 33, putative / location=Cvel_scaffold2533:2314-2922(-) / protein_length=203 / sequence_SO=supercontig / SO=protein_coding / is_pseudo=false